MLRVSGLPVATSTPTSDLDEQGVSVLIVEDHALLAQTLVFALNAEGCRARVAELIGPAHLLQQVRTHRPGVVLLDLHAVAAAVSALPPGKIAVNVRHPDQEARGHPLDDPHEKLTVGFPGG